MPESNPDKITREKINSLSMLPDPGIFDQHPAWEKLHARLREAPVKKHRRWYYTSAAAATVFVVAGLFLTNNSSRHLSPATGTKQETLTALAREKQAGMAINKLVITPIKNIPASVIKIAVPKHGKQARIFKERKANPSAVPASETVKSLYEIETSAGNKQGNDYGAASAPQVAVPPQSTPAVAPPVRKLPVVCLNEIEDNATETPPLERKKERSFVIKLFNTYPDNDTLFTSSSGNNIFKINLASKN